MQKSSLKGHKRRTISFEKWKWGEMSGDFSLELSLS